MSPFNASGETGGGSEMSPHAPTRNARNGHVDPERIDLRHQWGDIGVGYVRASWSAVPEHRHMPVQVIVPFRRPATPTALRAEWRSPTGRSCSRALEGGDSCVFIPDQPHTVIWEGEVEQLSFYIGAAYLAHVAHDLTVGAAVELGPSHTARDPFIRQLGTALRGTFAVADGPIRLHAEALVTVLAVHLLQISGIGGHALRPVAAGLDPCRLRRVTEYIEAHLTSDLALAALALIAELSPYHFARAFKAATGLPPHRYVVARRLARAQTLLRDSDRAIGEIATDVGLRTQSHLTALFREHLATTPHAYRHGAR